MEKPPLYLVRLQGCSIYQQLQLEEALLRSDDRNWCLMNEGSPPAIVMGISGKKEQWIDLPYYRQKPIPLIRRFTGGGTVVVDESTVFVTLICNTHAVPVSPYPQPILSWNGTLLKPALESIDFQIRENDYTVGSKKFGGNAQYICKERWLHHTSLLWDYCPFNMNYLKKPPRMPAYRRERGHEDFLCRLNQYLPEKSVIWEKFTSSLSRHFILAESSVQEVKLLLERPYRKMTCIENGTF